MLRVEIHCLTMRFFKYSAQGGQTVSALSCLGALRSLRDWVHQRHPRREDKTTLRKRFDIIVPFDLSVDLRSFREALSRITQLLLPADRPLSLRTLSELRPDYFDYFLDVVEKLAR